MLNSTAVTSVDESKCIIFSCPSPGHCPMGLGRSSDLRWIEKRLVKEENWVIEWYIVRRCGQKLQLGN